VKRREFIAGLGSAARTNPALAEIETRELQAAPQTLRVRLLFLNASDQSEFEAAFTTLVRERTGGLVIGSEPLFFHHFDQHGALAARHPVPAISPSQEATVAGGLMSYHDSRSHAGGTHVANRKPTDGSRQCFPKGEAEPLGALEVDHQLHFCDLLHRQIGRLVTLEKCGPYRCPLGDSNGTTELARRIAWTTST
jgi:hypothetical protein